MNKKIIVIIIIVLLIGAGVYGLSANKKDKDAQTATTSNNTSSQSQPDSSSTAPVSTNTVSIENFAFSPPDITVKKGTTVTWTNNDSTPHTVTASSSNGGPKSQTLKAGDKYSFTFDQSGKFNYHCDIHESMLGTVTVTE